MTILLTILLVICLLGVLHSYLFYPLFLFLTRTKNSIQKNEALNLGEQLPEVSILLAAYNEEKVIAEKIQRSLQTTYPLHKLKILIGSDASTDRTDQIISDFAKKYPDTIQLVSFPGRTGKSGIINRLAEMANTELFILTDANVFFEPDTIFELVKHFKRPEIFQVAANIIKVAQKTEGIASQEKKYIHLENRIKKMESDKWESIMGAEGGCYAIRKKNFSPVPPRFFMDDFYITMNVLEQGGKVLFEENAICYEDVPTLQAEEYKRKIRISIGNFQNLRRYKHLLWPFWSGVGFAFLSHKVLRWFTPFFLLIALCISFVLMLLSPFFAVIFIPLLLLILSPLFDYLFSSCKIHFKLLRYPSHFVYMNMALLQGFIQYSKGVKSNIWQPTQRNV